MERSLHNARRGRGALRFAYLGGFLCIVCVALIAPWLRDALGSVFAQTARDTELSALPRQILIERLRAAETEVQRTRYQAVLYADLAQENGKRSATTTAASYKTAAIIAYPPKTHYDSLVIDAGQDAGVAVGDLVYSGPFIIGVISSASSKTAVVELFSSPGTTREVKIGTPESIVTLTGVGGGSFEAKVPGDIAVATSSLAKDIQSGAKVAQVVGKTTKPADTLVTILLTSPASFSSWSTVDLVHLAP